MRERITAIRDIARPASASGTPRAPSPTTGPGGEPGSATRKAPPGPKTHKGSSSSVS
jgi:hypothetical protein